MGERTSALKKMKFKKSSDCDLWMKVLIPEMMSSEESGNDEDDEEILKVLPLPWRARKVTKMFQQLDLESSKYKTPQSRRQRKRRVLGESSERARPDRDGNLPNWVFQ